MVAARIDRMANSQVGHYGVIGKGSGASIGHGGGGGGASVLRSVVAAVPTVAIGAPAAADGGLDSRSRAARWPADDRAPSFLPLSAGTVVSRSIDLVAHPTLHAGRRACTPARCFLVLVWCHAIVAAPMRTRFDQFGKQMVRAALQGRGSVETDAEVAADTRRIDLWFTPGSGHASAPDHLGLLGRMTSGASTFEFFHRTPSGDDLATCVIKHGDFRHFLSQRWTLPLAPTPTQWVISAGRPDAGIEGLWLRPISSWPPGIYEGPPLLWTRLVVVNELPVTRDTLLLRLLGAGSVLKQAIAELKSLDVEAPERTLALPILLRLRLEVPADPAKQTRDDQEFLMNTQDIVETWRREAIQEGRQEGVQQGRQEGVQQGRQEGVASSLIDLYEVRFGAMPEDLRAVIEDTHDEATLRAWVKLAGTRGADEVAEAIRASRPS
jgi:hypothetical protein